MSSHRVIPRRIPKRYISSSSDSEPSDPDSWEPSPSRYADPPRPARRTDLSFFFRQACRCFVCDELFIRPIDQQWNNFCPPCNARIDRVVWHKPDPSERDPPGCVLIDISQEPDSSSGTETEYVEPVINLPPKAKRARRSIIQITLDDANQIKFK